MGRHATGTVAWRGTPGRWFARVSVRDATGKLSRPWIDLERPDLKNTPADKAVAQRLARKDARDATKKTYVGPKQAAALTATVAELETKWFTLCDTSKLSETTRYHHKAYFHKHVVSRLGQYRVVDLTVPILRAWVRAVGTEQKPTTGKPLSARYVRLIANTLRKFLDDVKAEGWAPLTVNLMRDSDVRRELKAYTGRPSRGREAITYFDVRTFEQLLASNLTHVWFGLLLVSVSAGERPAEGHGLTFKHIRKSGTDPRGEAVRPHLRVRQQALTRSDKKPVRISESLKTRDSKRDIPLHPDALAWLTWWQDEGWARYVGRKPSDDDLVFCDARGKPWRPSADKFRRLLEAAKLPTDFVTMDGDRIPFTWLSIRHTFATWLGAQSIDGDVVDALLGHAPRSIRGRHYAAPTFAKMEEAVRSITLKLPARPGIPSRESSLSGNDSAKENSDTQENQPVAIADTQALDTSKSSTRQAPLPDDDRTENQPQNRSKPASNIGDETVRSDPKKPEEFGGGTIWDAIPETRDPAADDALHRVVARRAKDPKPLRLMGLRTGARRRRQVKVTLHVDSPTRETDVMTTARLMGLRNTTRLRRKDKVTLHVDSPTWETDAVTTSSDSDMVLWAAFTVLEDADGRVIESWDTHTGPTAQELEVLRRTLTREELGRVLQHVYGPAVPRSTARRSARAVRTRSVSSNRQASATPDAGAEPPGPPEPPAPREVATARAQNADAPALDALADALLARLLPHIRAALAADRDDASRLMTPRDTPSPRATMEACRQGLIDGAKKLHRHWTFPVAAWHAYVERAGAAPAPRPGAPVNPDDAELDELRRELGFTPKRRRSP